MTLRHHTSRIIAPSFSAALILGLLCLPTVVKSQSPIEQTGLLFQNDTPLELVITTDLTALIEDKSDEPEYRKGHLALYENKIQVNEFNIKIRARGHSRRLYDYCDFPPLKLNFIKDETTHTIFEGQDKIKLATTCREDYRYSQYLIQEYLIYKTYNVLTDVSLKVRLVHVKYVDSQEKEATMHQYGFLIEDEDVMADRIGGNIYEKRISHPDLCDQASADLLALFEFLIGNTDWWIHTGHNVELVESPVKGLLPVPYDFDLSGVISTPYARPNTSLPIKNVRERYYKGCCRTLDSYEPLIDHFNINREKIFSLYSNCKWLDRMYKKLAIKYFDEFYAIINDPVTARQFLLGNCINSDGIFTSGNNP